MTTKYYTYKHKHIENLTYYKVVETKSKLFCLPVKSMEVFVWDRLASEWITSQWYPAIEHMSEIDGDLGYD